MSASPKEVAARLGVSGATLRRWSVEFGEALSPDARGPAPGHARRPQRAYSEGDIAVLRRAKTLLDGGFSMDQVRLELAVPAPSASTELLVPALAALEASHRRELAARDEVVAGLRTELELRDEIIRGLRRELESAHEATTTAEALAALRAELAPLIEAQGRRWNLLGR
jgi:DNA-binding transcriptional MerR regulator